jgi:uncharacterized repeat protein (TIGR01451 family)
VSFAGLDHNTWGAGWPPDTVGDVGPNHYVQAVNTSIGIFTKTGTQLAAFTFNTLWATAGTGTACDSSNQGDPLVVYDPQADRWIVADFAFTGIGDTPPFYECIAVSQTANPVSGGWYFYAVRTDDATHPWFADYPKMGIWPDGLYMTGNMFDSTDTFREVRVWAFNRGDLESGAALRQVVVDLNTTTYFSLLPSNMRSVTGVPPAGRENILSTESQTLFATHMFKFHVDYSGAGSTFTGPTNVSQTSYTVAAATVPSPGNSLDSLRERLMMQAQYTNIGGTESLWVQHTVRTGASPAPTGIQWEQINVTGGTIVSPPVQQQIYGNLAADGVHRWMGSLAVDRAGDMALGYSASSATLNPDIRYNARLATDPINTLPQGETTMLPGLTRGTQSGTCGGVTCVRWGDYTAMSIDPNGCTFWYTNQWYATTGLNWQTRIGSFSLPSCTPVASTNDLGVSVSDSPDPVHPGQDLTYTITATQVAGGSASTVHLSDTLPAGTTFRSLAAPGSWSCTTPAVGGTGTVSCDIGTLGSGASDVFTLVVRPDASTPDATVLTNTPAISSATADSNSANDSDPENTTVQANDLSSAASLTIAFPGDTINVVDGPLVAGDQTVQVNDGGTGAFGLLNIANKTDLTVNGGAGSDAIGVNNPTAATGVSTITVNGETAVDSATATATAPGETTTVNLGPGGGQTVSAPQLGGIAGTFKAVSDAIVLSDAADATGDTGTWALVSGNGRLTGVAPGTVDTSAATVDVTLGSGADRLTVTGTDPAASTKFNLGNGNDRLSLTGAATVAGTALGATSGGGGTNELSYDGYGSGVTVDLSTGAATGFPAGVTNFLDVTGSPFGDSLTGEANENVLAGGAGIDTLTGGGGADTLYGGTEADTIHGNAGNDSIQGGKGADVVTGDGDNDSIRGGQAGDDLTGGTGVDFLHGNGGADHLDVADGAGGDTADGDAGADTCVSDPGDTRISC